MSSNWFNSSNTTAKDMNPLFLMYMNQIDTNQDGQISDDELAVFQQNNLDFDVSIFNESFSDSEAVFSENIVSDIFNKSASVELVNLQGLDMEAFSQLGTSEKSNENSNEFWSGLSDFGFDKLFGLIDTGKDGILSQEELLSFAAIDGNVENLSLYDLQQIITGIDSEQVLDEIPIQKQQAKRLGSRGGKDGGYRNEDVPNVDIKTQFTNNVNTAREEFSKSAGNYKNALDGNINDSNVNNKKQAMSDAYDAWQAELIKKDPILSQNIATATNEIADINNQIASKEKEVFDNEVNLSNCTATLDTAQARTISLKDKKSSLESARSGLDSSNEADAKKLQRYNEQINKLETNIKQAETAEKNAKTAKEKAQKALEDSKSQKLLLEETLDSKQITLAGYMADAAFVGTKNPILVQLQNDYETKKNEYEEALKNYKDGLKSEALKKNDKVNTNQKALDDYLVEQELKTYDRGLLNYDQNFADIFNKYLLAGASKSNKDCGGAVRRALYKTMKELYPEAAHLFAEGAGVIGADWDNQYMKDSPFFVEITNMYTTSELEKMIENGELKGSIINYEKYKDGKSGHVEGVTTDGLTSDYTRDFELFRSGSNLGKADYHVYLPVTPTEEEIQEYIRKLTTSLDNYDSPIL